jgi:hypothetical protein
MPTIIRTTATPKAIRDVFLNRVGLLISLSLERKNESGKQQAYSKEDQILNIDNWLFAIDDSYPPQVILGVVSASSGDLRM